VKNQNKKNTGELTYSAAGVDYNTLDPFKRLAQAEAGRTAANIMRFGFSEVPESRGESAYLVETKDCYLAHVEEGLGTKNLIADEMLCLTGKSYYANIAQDTVAMIVNDMVTLGALPVSVAMHLAVGDSGWFNNKTRYKDLVRGWRKACDLARCVWGPGETPALKNIIIPETAVLAGSAMGVAKPKNRRIIGDVRAGDSIVFVESSGIHANGLTLARQIAAKLPQGYLTKMENGRTYGAALLDPTHIYVGLVDDCQSAGVKIHYAANITGHGWRKLMRLDKPFAYIIKKLPRPRAVFGFMQKHGPISDVEAYANFNMGAGFALYVAKNEVNTVVEAAKNMGLKAFAAGRVAAGKKSVIIEPLGITYSADTLALR
jgi:phosphoribosylformylglycinamidine cyclo-ligase